VSGDLVIVGTGGFAREVHQVVEDLNDDGAGWNVLGFLDDEPSRHGTQVHGLPVLGGTDWVRGREGIAVAVGVGATAGRRRVVRVLTRASAAVEFPTLVHPLAWVGNRIDVGTGTIVCAGSLLTTDLRLGDHVIVNLDCTIGHDSSIGDFVTMAPSVNVSGAVEVGEGCDLGTGASIIQGVAIGEWTILGAGSVVTKDLPANVTAVGVPAKPIKERPAGWHEDEP
jgi:sugar O-acyltransferase (sialic acid O-acetyltransferase NeuD family)